MRKIFTTRRRIVIAGASVAVLLAGTAGAAYAYFTASGSGNGYASVGSATNWQVTGSSDTSNDLYPNSGSENLTFTITNPGSQAQTIGSVTAQIDQDGSGNVLTSLGNSIGGCQASWFTATITSPSLSGTSVAAGGQETVTVEVTMQDSGTNQDPCQGISGPKVTLSVN